MKRRRLTAALLAAVVLCAAALSGCAKGEKSAGGEKEITVAVNSETGTLDPAGAIALTYLSYSVTALDELLTYDENGDIEYRAAESYEVNEDSTVWTFHLREDALWSDGTPVTSEDFLNTIRRALDPASGSGYAVYLFPIENAEEIYNQEVSMDTLLAWTRRMIIRWSSVWRRPRVFIFLICCGFPYIRHPVRSMQIPVDSGWDKDPATSLANGPFMLAEYVPDQYFVLEKNESYWNKDAVRLDRITYRFFDDTPGNGSGLRDR